MFKEKTKLIVTDFQFKKLEKFVELIEFYNQNFNLTGFSGDKLWKEGIYESIITMNFISEFVKKDKISVLDIGAGVGFPSIPFLIVSSKIDLTICESRKKRCQFLQIVARKLDLEFELICERAERIENKNFDLITARALANLQKLEILVKKIVTQKTVVAFIKGPKVFDEQKNCQNCNYEIMEIKNNMDKKIYVAIRKK
ncbi:16S rRNA (guanine(527)-N(7))-methyltransferase RsmG [Mycoplasma sp. 'Moose RK']|uniref:16S rRNA (guanine(527)-N(7))-methyltransferase RsmG n=1 Tax=Mycoplasma sp. 'Moose RK' TaxID=2780095 RepID=UPI0018C2030F|nr:16S rRNA (guanine(527)-N(7))-methyltransferase RsmG [Mycoplasma sp. 'Moose RK']MBG0730608.1 16S rRNA (guanine(527)-N(7))-methyltransferase RsmG [Mycoplasma sp. 'Moose RK']